MTAKDQRRLDVLARVDGGRLRADDAASLLGLSERQLRRLLKAYREEGAAGLVHGNRGRRPALAVPEDLRERVRVLAMGPYAGVNHTHLSELLAEREAISLPRSTLSDILKEAGITSPRPQRRRSLHRSRRERYPQEGMLLQIDASHHDWFEGRGPRPVLLAVIDDATGKVVAARFHDKEDARGYFLLLGEVCQRSGVPHALYSDKHSVFWATRSESVAEQLAGRQSTTQFGRAMAELGIRLIAAHSPQAKGRIERLWGTLQDRLVSELRLATVGTIEQANNVLPAFVRKHNLRFSVPAADAAIAYRPRRTRAELDTILCFKYDRAVAKDNCVKVDQVVLQILPGANRAGYTRATVTVCESLEARWSVVFQGRVLPTRIIPLRTLLTSKRTPTPKPIPVPVSQHTLPWKPPADHPWKKYPTVTKSLGT